MNKAKTLAVLFIFLYLNYIGQQQNPDLQKFSDTTLFNLHDSTCFNVSGEWTGEEIQYDETKSFIKVKFKVIFHLQQQGNRVFGTSYIEDKYRGSYGDMKIRGLVTGNKLHFEEYEIVNEKFFERGVVWCLRSGEMTIKPGDKLVALEGLSYSGYASDTYEKCTDYAKMTISKTVAAVKETNSYVTGKILPAKMDLLIFPNPCIDEATVSYELSEACHTRIDVFSLTGAHIETILNGQLPAGKQRTPLSIAAYAPGVYLVRLQAGNSFFTRQLVKSK